MDLNLNCLGACNPRQIVNINLAINDLSGFTVLDNCNNTYPENTLEFAYSLDSICWSCYMSKSEAIKNTININSDFYVRIKVNGTIGSILYNNEKYTDYKCSIAQGFNFTYACDSISNPNIYNPYANMDCAIALQQQLTENVACMFGIPIYYIKLKPNSGSKDLTFKEYTLMNVDSIKQIKMVVADGVMPSSKPEFSDFALDWQSDWDTEITKGMFATAFGINAQPMEGDLIYVPMQKRMWMVNGAYEEKKDALMWNAMTFKVTLVKYQEKGSVDLGDTQQMVDALVKNKYEDLFGDDENIESEEENITFEKSAPDNLFPVYESDSLRKYVTINDITFKDESYYQKGTVISDSRYLLNQFSKIIYQNKYCGEDGILSFIIQPFNQIYSGNLIELGSLIITINQEQNKTKISVNNLCDIEIENNKTYFIYIRWNRMLNNLSISAAKYTHNEKIPEYMLRGQHYYFDIDNSITKSSSYSVECIQNNKVDLIINGFNGIITNIKLFNKDNDNISEILQMLPTNQHLLINDTARKIILMNGISLH